MQKEGRKLPQTWHILNWRKREKWEFIGSSSCAIFWPFKKHLVWKRNNPQSTGFDPCLIVTWRELCWLVSRARTPHGDSSPDCNCFVKSVIRLSDTVSRWRKSDSGAGSYNLSSQIWLWRVELWPAQWSRLLNTLNRGNLRRSEKPKMSDRRSRTNQSQIENVESRGANYNTEDSLNHFKMSMSSINYSNDLRIITLVSLYIQCTMYYNICFLFYVRVRNEILGITKVWIVPLSIKFKYLSPLVTIRHPGADIRRWVGAGH